MATTKKVTGVNRAKRGSTKAAKGAHGSAFASLLIKSLEDKIAADVKDKVSQKQRLGEMVNFTTEDHTELRATLQARYDTVKAGEFAEDGEANAASLKASLSLWKRLSTAVSAGWKPDLSKSWGDLGKDATDHNSAQAAAQATTRINEQIKKIVDDASIVDPKVKEAKITLLKATLPIEHGSPTAKTSARGRTRGTTTKSLWDKVLPIIKDAPLQEIERLHAQLGAMIAERTKKMGVPQNTTPAKPTPGVPFTPEVKEHATAKGSDRKAKGRKVKVHA